MTSYIKTGALVAMTLIFVSVMAVAPVASAADLGDFDDYGGFSYDTPSFDDYGGFSYDTPSFDDYGGYSYDTPSFDDFGGFSYDTSFDDSTTPSFDDFGGFSYNDNSFDDFGGFSYDNQTFDDYGGFNYTPDSFDDTYLGTSYDDDYLGTSYDNDYLGSSYGDGAYLGSSYSGNGSACCGAGGYGSVGYGAVGYGVGAVARPVAVGYGSFGPSAQTVVSPVSAPVTRVTPQPVASQKVSYVQPPVQYYPQPVPTPIPQPQPRPIPQPIPQPVPSNLSCQLNANIRVIQNGQSAMLSWTSMGAVRAFLSDGLGNTALNGSLSVRPEASRNYVLTVVDAYGRQATCATTVNVQGTPYVSLTQIPYTGVDFGPVGNVIYWFVLASMSGIAGWMIVAKKHILTGSFMSLVGASMHNTNPEAMIVHEAIIETPEVTYAPQAQPEKVAVVTDVKTTDTMQLGVDKDGMPRITLNRS